VSWIREEDVKLGSVIKVMSTNPKAMREADVQKLRGPGPQR
jgi:hypothetical protein